MRRALDSTRGFERLFTDLMSLLMNAAPDALDRHLREGLTRLASRAGVERASLARFSDDRDSLTVTHSSTTPAIPTSLPAGLRWYVGELRRGHCLTISRVPGDLPMEAAAERETFCAERIRSHVAVPLSRSGRAWGVIALATSLQARLWMPEDVQRLRVIGEIMMSAVERLESDEAMRRLREELTHLARVVSLGDLTIALTHELNQPLTAIKTNAQAARRLLAGGVPSAELDDALGDIAADATRAADLIERLAVLFRRGELERIAVDVNQVVRDFEVVARAEARRHGAPLVLRLAADLLPVRGDRVQLQQVLLNLIRNAAEAMADVAPTTRDVEVSTSLTAPGQITVSVADSGCSIDAAVFDRLFHPFYTTKRDGLGMGLAISRSIVEAHGGRLWAERRASGGLVLSFTLPAEVGPATADSPFGLSDAARCTVPQLSGAS
ncbi:MAG: sensor histidine kinase [Candidatus Rokuibacteriota bacterium]